MSVSLLFGCSINSYTASSCEAKWLIKFYMLFVCWENYRHGTSAAAGREFPGAAGEAWAVQGRCWDPHGNQDSQSGHCLPLAAPPESPQQESLALNQSLVAAPRSLLCLFSSGEHLLDMYPQFNDAELLIPPTGTTPAEARALTGYVIKISTSEKPWGESSEPPTEWFRWEGTFKILELRSSDLGFCRGISFCEWTLEWFMC